MSAGAPTLPLSLRMAMRELRGGLSGFYIFIACIALGVAAIAGVNSVSRALTEGVASEGRVILGGDIAFELNMREANDAELAFLDERGSVGMIADMRAMARLPDGSAQSLVELKAVDSAYPHGGALRLEEGGDGQALLQQQDGAYGALAAPGLLDRLGAATGDRIMLGSLELQLRGTIASEPDRLSSGIGFGPRLIVSIEALRETGLLRPGSLVEWTYRLRLPGPGTDTEIERVSEAALAELPDAGWSIRSRDNASPGLTRNIERFAQFLTLVGLTALAVGGVGVANAVSGFVDLKRPAIATFKCLGASGALVFRIYLIQILAIATIGIVVGLVTGAALPFVTAFLLADVLPLSSDVGLYPGALGLSALYGLLVTLSFALSPLGRARAIPAVELFADRAVASPVHPPRIYRIAQGFALACLLALALAFSGDAELALIYAAGVIGSFLVLRLVAVAIMNLARRAGTVRGTAPRIAVRSIHRPGALTPSVVLSLGLGLALLVSLALIDSNLRNQLSGSIVERAPDFFFLDIQGSEREAFAAILAETAPDGDIETVPMLRGRISAVKGVPAAEVEPGEGGRWALRGDRGITYSDEVPENSSLVTGSWWEPGYDGEPLVSMEDEIAEALDLEVGDEVTVNVLGREITTRLANTRRLEWESLSINFVMVFSPNTFRGAPNSHLATLRLPDGASRDAERAVISSVTEAFPGVTTISVRDAITAINAVIGDLATAVRAAASLALVISVLVLGGALAAGQRQRQQDAVILKTLGATRATLLAAFSMEYGLLGLATGIFGIAAGAAAAWYVVANIMGFTFTFFPTIAVAAAVIALVVTLGLGLAGTWRILSVKPAPYLRNL